MLSLVACIDDHSEDDGDGAEVQVGDMLPSFHVVTDSGEKVSNSSLRGAPSVVVFFHTACPDCQHELPILDEFYSSHREQQAFRMICIAREEGGDEIAAYWESHSLHLPYAPQTDRTIYNRFAHSRIPRIYMCDSDTRIRYVYDDTDMPDIETLNTALSSLIAAPR